MQLLVQIYGLELDISISLIFKSFCCYFFAKMCEIRYSIILQKVYWDKFQPKIWGFRLLILREHIYQRINWKFGCNWCVQIMWLLFRLYLHVMQHWVPRPWVAGQARSILASQLLFHLSGWVPQWSLIWKPCVWMSCSLRENTKRYADQSYVRGSSRKNGCSLWKMCSDFRQRGS